MNQVERLKRVLEVSGLTQEELAKRVGVSFASLNAWVNGRAQPRRGALLAIDRVCAELAIGSPLSARGYFAFANGENGAFANGEYGAPANGAFSTVQPPTLSEQQIDQLLAGEGDADTIDVLQNGQHANFLKNLASIVEMMPKGTMSEAALLLDTAKERNGATCQQALMYPHIAMWAATCLRSVLGVTDVGSVDQHGAHFSAIAAVVAWKCGIEDFSITVPVRNSGVVLPSLGRAVLVDDDDAQRALLVCTDGEMSITTPTQTVPIPRDPSVGTYQWEPIRKISVSTAGITLELSIDDVDPYRMQDPSLPSAVAARRLDQLDFKTWKEHLADAWAVLVTRHYEYAVGIAQGISVVVPIEGEVLHETAFFRNGFGAIASTVGASSVWMAQSMVEEFQRTKLNALHSLKTVYTATSDEPRYFAPFSNGPKPFNSLIESFYSTAATAEFWGAQYSASFGEQQFEAAVNCHMRHCWEDSLFHRLGESGELTTLGNKMLTAIRVRGNHSKQVIPSEVVELVRNMTIDHRLCFRVANVACDADDIERLGRAWTAGMACPVNKVVHQYLDLSKQEVFGQKRRRQLRELRLSHPENFADLLENEHYLDLVVPGAVAADAYLVAGRFDEATQHYQASIMTRSDDAEAWAGLAVVGARSGNETASTLGRFPEIVEALHCYLRVTHGRAEEPLQLARWLEPLLLRMDDLAFEDEYEYVTDGGH